MHEVLRERPGEHQVTVRFVGETEGTMLNETYRRGRGATNVLSFPFEVPLGTDMPSIGDIAVCVPIVEREASAQGKSVHAHCAHLVVHGALHLLGYDHLDSADARRMESAETAILSRLGFADPYAPTPDP